MTLARLGIAYVPSGTSSASLAITTLLLGGGLARDPAHRSHVVEHAAPVEHVVVRERLLGDRAERAALDEILEGRAVAHGGERRSMELLELRAIRLGPRIGARVVAFVPDEGEHPARPQHARELRHGLVVREPVERLCCEHSVDGRVGERQLLRGARVALGRGHDLLEDGAHPVERLDREHSSVVPREHARQLPGAGPHVDDGGLGAERQDSRAPHRGSPAASARIPPRRGRSSSPARRDQPTPASRKARFSLSISRAITMRWIWFVPS